MRAGVVLIVLSVSACAEPQNRGEIQGEVCDEDTGAPVVGLSVQHNGDSVVTDADGHFRLTNVSAGEASVRIGDLGRSKVLVRENDIAVMFDPACRASNRDAPPFAALGRPMSEVRVARSATTQAGGKPPPYVFASSR